MISIIQHVKISSYILFLVFILPTLGSIHLGASSYFPWNLVNSKTVQDEAFIWNIFRPEDWYHTRNEAGLNDVCYRADNIIKTFAPNDSVNIKVAKFTETMQKMYKIAYWENVNNVVFAQI